MSFPVYLHVFGYVIHPHVLFDLLAYPVAMAVWRFERRRDPMQKPDLVEGFTTLALAILGAAIGAKLLAWAEHWPIVWEHRGDWRAWLGGGKTLVGALLGGWLGVEVAKKILRVQRRTGDAYVLPLAVGIALGRVGCFLTGLDDHTHGVATSLPWGVDFGDGVRRHPTQLYEIAVVLALGVGLTLARRRFVEPGDRFRVFIGGYLAFRFAVEFIKPVYNPYLGLSAIQVASLVGCAWAAWGLVTRRETTRGRP